MATSAELHVSTPQATYVQDVLDTPLPADTLLAIGFGADCALPDDPRCLRVALEPLAGSPRRELWRCGEPALLGRDGEVRYATGGGWLMAVLEVDEREHAGITAATNHAYREFLRFNAASGYPQVLRIWNYLDAITSGEGDDERYRQFCVGRAEAFGEAWRGPYPAATAIGRRDGAPILQLYWLAVRTPGMAIENPRQVSAFRYPRQYGPAAPRFSRAMRSGPMLLVSGTASIVGHATVHAEGLAAQLAETLANLDAVRASAQQRAPGLSGHGLFKVYLRDRTAAEAVISQLGAYVGDPARLVVLEADVCRRDLHLEIDCTLLP